MKFEEYVKFRGVKLPNGDVICGYEVSTDFLVGESINPNIGYSNKDFEEETIIEYNPLGTYKYYFYHKSDMGKYLSYLKGVSSNPLSTQEGGNHYKEMKIQPIEFIHANNIPFCEANAIKYLLRWRSKNGLEDLKKAKHYIDLLIQLEGLEEKDVEKVVKRHD